jgi:hypothetical protein
VLFEADLIFFSYYYSDLDLQKRHHNHDGFGREIYSRDNSIRKEQKQMAKAQKQR